MKKNSSAFIAFIDEKFAPLALKVKIIIAVMVVILPVVIFYFAYFQSKITTLNRLNTEIVTLNQQIVDAKKRASQLEKVEEEYKATEARFAESAVLLPKEKEIPQLLKDISALGRNAGLDFNTFKPLTDVKKDFYAEIPISIKVRGPYHNMGFFFDQVRNLDRIVSVNNVKMSSPKEEGGEMLLNTDTTLLTYRFTDEKSPAKK
jgi:type IV pilus assembly protein PilO